MKMGTEFWVGHVAAAKLETIPASEYARRHGLPGVVHDEMMLVRAVLLTNSIFKTRAVIPPPQFVSPNPVRRFRWYARRRAVRRLCTN